MQGDGTCPETPLELSLTTDAARGAPVALGFARRLICICAWCKKVRDGAVWRPLGVYVAAHLHIEFSHGICKDCLRKLDLAGQKLKLVSHSPPKAKRSAEGGPSRATGVQTRRYMVVEHIKDADAVYQRLWDRGRRLPYDLVLVSVWFDEKR